MACPATTTSVTGSRAAVDLGFQRKNQAVSGSRGFTLLELVVVLVIVGVVFTSAVLVLPLGNVAPVAKELEAFAQRVERARDQALFDTRPRGLGVWYGGYAFFDWYPETGWLASDDTETRGFISFEYAEVLDLVAAGTRITVSDKAVPDPQVVFAPNGEVTPFEARISGLSGYDYLFSIDALGDVRYSIR